MSPAKILPFVPKAERDAQAQARQYDEDLETTLAIHLNDRVAAQEIMRELTRDELITLKLQLEETTKK